MLCEIPGFGLSLAVVETGKDIAKHHELSRIMTACQARHHSIMVWVELNSRKLVLGNE